MADVLSWIEGLSVSTFVRESGSLWAYPMFLFGHTLGISIVAGGSTIISFGLLGLWPATSVKPLERLYPVIWIGFALNLFTGLGLLMANTSTGMNPVFWVKMMLVGGGVLLLTVVRGAVFTDPRLATGVPSYARVAAWASLVCWFGAIVAGRLIAYVGSAGAVY